MSVKSTYDEKFNSVCIQFGDLAWDGYYIQPLDVTVFFRELGFDTPEYYASDEVSIKPAGFVYGEPKDIAERADLDFIKRYLSV